MQKITLHSILIVSIIYVNAQGIAIGQWRDHLPYGKCICVTEAGNRIYCATPYNLFYYDKDDNSVTRMSKITGLSDIGISTIKYNSQYDILVIAYTSTNIDLVEKDEIINISDIKRKTILGKKTINNITFYNNYAYLSCGFGIVVVDLVKKEIKDTYYIGHEGAQIDVKDITIADTVFYAATESGIYKAMVNNPNLANYESWTKDTLIPNPNSGYNFIKYYNKNIITSNSKTGYYDDTLFYFNGSAWNRLDTNTYDVFSINVDYNKLIITHNYCVYIYDTSLTIKDIIWTYNPGVINSLYAIADKDNIIWIADQVEGLVKVQNIWNCEKIKLSGPLTNYVSDMSVEGNKLWIVPGGKNSSWQNIWIPAYLSYFIEEEWGGLNSSDIPEFDTDTIRDIVCVAVDPSNPERVYAGSWFRGLIELNNNSLVNIYNTSNSPLEVPSGGSGYYWIGVGGLCFDDNNDLWITNSGAKHALHVKRTDNSWQSFDFSSVADGVNIGDLAVDSYNQKWLILKNDGLLVFNDNNTSSTSDDEFIVLNTNIGNGKLPSLDVYCIAKDLDGEMWIGTDKGIAVFYSPENVFSGNDFDAQQILIEQDGYAQYLLEYETVTAIAVDGANKKWIGTEKGGVFYMSADGTEQLLHFNEENSPLFSNTITSIAIDHETGEVFFGTEKGIVSYKGTATMGGETYSDSVYAYPNPVKENYSGYIAVKGLVTDADVKITDISGNLVYEVKAEGGQAIWNGNNLYGKKVSTGVYLVYCSNEDGSQTLVTKILCIK